MTFNVAANAAQHFLPLKNGDVVQVTLNAARTGLEEFWQLSRASGAKPRSAVELSRADMEWFGLTAEPWPARPGRCWVGPFGPVPSLTYIVDLADLRGSLDRPVGSLHQLTKAVENLGGQARPANA